jgi:MFS family permease
MVADITPIPKQVEAFGILRIAANVGWAAGPAIGGFIAAFSYAFLFFLTALCNLCVFFIITFYIYESKPRAVISHRLKKSVFSTILKHKTFVKHCILSTFMFIVYMQLFVTLVVYAGVRFEITEIQIGLIFFLNGLMVVFLQWPVSRSVANVPHTKTLALGALIYSIGYLCIIFVNSFFTLLLCAAIITLGELVSIPTTIAYTGKLSSPSIRGSYMGVFGLFTGIGHSVAPFVGCTIIQYTYQMPYLLWLFVFVIGVVTAICYVNLEKPQSNPDVKLCKKQKIV